MKTIFASSLLALCCSCATIVGGSKYIASINVSSNTTAEIIYNGRTVGYGSSRLEVRRKDANMFKFAVKEDDCETQIFSYNTRAFRGWAFLGSVVIWTFITPTGIPLPYGIVVDALTGSLWKPDSKDPGIVKGDYKNYYYNVSYKGCKEESVKPNNKLISVDEEFQEIDDQEMIKFQKLRELKELYDNGTITKEEFDQEKKKILDKY